MTWAIRHQVQNVPSVGIGDAVKAVDLVSPKTVRQIFQDLNR